MLLPMLDCARKSIVLRDVQYVNAVIIIKGTLMEASDYKGSLGVWPFFRNVGK